MSGQYFYGHGKLLLSGEYLVLDGAKCLALPLKVGQNMTVTYKRSYSPKLYWKSYDHEGNLWFEATFELWHFNVQNVQELNEANSESKSESNLEKVKVLQKILIQARKQNVHFLRDEVDTFVETKLEFDRNWGFGSSSTLIYNIAQWAYISPYELQEKTFGGSGYDVACAQAMGPITYQIQKQGPQWSSVSFDPHFKDSLYFVYLNKKQNSRSAIKSYQQLDLENKRELVKVISELTDKLIKTVDLLEFEQLLYQHENIMSEVLSLPRVKDQFFSDYWGAVKSLGAWGGDFVLVTSNKDSQQTREYFMHRGYETVISFDEIVCQNFSMLNISELSNLESAVDRDKTKKEVAVNGEV